MALVHHLLAENVGLNIQSNTQLKTVGKKRGCLTKRDHITQRSEKDQPLLAQIVKLKRHNLKEQVAFNANAVGRLVHSFSGENCLRR